MQKKSGAKSRPTMQKAVAIKMLGPTAEEAGRRIGCSGAAIRKWPEVLPARLVDRVIAAAVRAQFERTTVSALTGRVTLPPELFAYLWHETLMARAERARKFDAEALARRIAAHREARLASKQRTQARQAAQPG
jgi:hypothetical protein